MGDQEKSAIGCLSEIDRLSDLPDSILHHIVSFLGTKEACRTSLLSKRWVNIWSTGYILDFNRSLFKNVWKDSDRFVSFIETTMQRYSKRNLSIRKLTLEYKNFDKYIEPERIDRWLGIAVKNLVEDLSLDIDGTSEFPSSYGLPMILFSAKSLIRLKCSNLRVPRYPSVMLISLQFLELWYLNIDEHMLHHLISSCPLRKLLINGCAGIYNLSIPECSKLEWLCILETIQSDGLVNVETSSIQHFSYSGHDQVDAWWPFNFSLASKKYLSELNIYFIHIPDNVVDKLVPELSSIKIISVSYCSMPKNIRIASLTLEELVLTECFDLANIVLDAPQLKTFCYKEADLQKLSSITSSHSICNASLNFTQCDLDTQSLVKINRLLSGFKCCKVFSIDSTEISEEVLRVDFNQLCEIHAAPVEELKLSLSCSVSKKSFLIDLLDGVFWSCRPSKLSLTFHLLSNNEDAIVRSMLEIMEEVKCWKNSLKRFKVKRTKCSRFTMSRRFELRLRLYW